MLVGRYLSSPYLAAFLLTLAKSRWSWILVSTQEYTQNFVKWHKPTSEPQSFRYSLFWIWRRGYDRRSFFAHFDQREGFSAERSKEGNYPRTWGLRMGNGA